MKRIYSNPQTEVMPMMSAQVLCASGENHVTVDNNAQDNIIID